MLTYMSATIENDPYNGGIRITGNKSGSSIGSIKKLVVSRKIYGTSSWTDIYTKNITNANDFNIALLDITAKPEYSYSYTISLNGTNTTIEFQIYDNIKCVLDGLFVGNFDKQYVAYTNAETDTKKNNQVNYVVTLAGRTPYRVANSQVNYTTGSSSGLFTKLTVDKKKLVPDYNREYTNEILDFLTDGTAKILKTNDGDIWYVSIDDGANAGFNDRYFGMNGISFNWTEIGDVPPFGMVVLG